MLRNCGSRSTWPNAIIDKCSCCTRSRFPAVISTSSNQIIPALSDIYNTYGNANNQLSDNGPPFNSKAMKDFAQKRSLNIQNTCTPPLHPAANPVETFMKPLAKTAQ